MSQSTERKQVNFALDDELDAQLVADARRLGATKGGRARAIVAAFYATSGQSTGSK